MIDRINKKNIGKLAITVSLLVWLIDSMTNYISTVLGEMIYGNSYTQTADGMFSNVTYAFTIDMHLTYSLFTLFVLGVVLYISSYKDMEQKV